ncbi:MAG: T9SS type A sorting domain-containing protein, partial [Flavobacteriales bacterium]
YGASIQPSAIELGKVYIAGSGYSNPGVYMSSDNGDSFTALDQGLPQTMIYDIAPTLGDEFVFAATELGPYIYSSETNVWSNLSGDFAPDQIYWSVEFVDEIKTARFGTYGRGIWDFKLEEETSSVELAEYKNTNFSLYPVPAADFITVEFSAKGIYKVSIFDLQGRLVLEENTTGNSSFIIPIGTLKKGTYICKVNGESKSFVKL